MNYWKEGLFPQRSSWLSLPKYAGLFKINLAKAIFSTEPASWIKEASVVHLWKERHLPPRLLRWADTASNYVINTMAGLISEIVRYNCIQPFISEAKQLILCVQVWWGPKATPPPPFFQSAIGASMTWLVFAWYRWQDRFLQFTNNYPPSLIQ